MNFSTLFLSFSLTPISIRNRFTFKYTDGEPNLKSKALTHYSDEEHVRAEPARNAGSPRHGNSTEQSLNEKGLIRMLVEKKCGTAQRTEAVPELAQHKIQSAVSPRPQARISHFLISLL